MRVLALGQPVALLPHQLGPRLDDVQGIAQTPAPPCLARASAPCRRSKPSRSATSAAHSAGTGARLMRILDPSLSCHRRDRWTSPRILALAADYPP